MKNEPWIDGAITPPKVGSVIRARTKDDMSIGVVEWREYHIGSQNVIYYVLEESPREYVPPVEPLPELEKVPDGYAVSDHKDHNGTWQMALSKCSMISMVARSESKSFCVRMVNHAIRELRKA